MNIENQLFAIDTKIDFPNDKIYCSNNDEIYK